MLNDQNPSPEIVSLIDKAFPRARIIACEQLLGGLINSNYKIRLDILSEPVVLRIYERNAESCAKEVSLLRLVCKTVPVPEVLYESTPTDCAFVILSYVSGITFQNLKRNQDKRAIEQASYAIGKTLAAIGQYKFSARGIINSDLKVAQKYLDGPDEIPGLVDRWLDSAVLKERLTRELQDRLRRFVWDWAPRLRALDDERSLVHGDFGSRNLLLRPAATDQSWMVSGVLDWEFALSGSPLMDIGHFLRYETRSEPLREPHFSRGYKDGGGMLPEDWQELARALDLTALVDLLTRQDLPADILSEVLELVHATLSVCGAHNSS